MKMAIPSTVALLVPTTGLCICMLCFLVHFSVSKLSGKRMVRMEYILVTEIQMKPNIQKLRKG
jgi:hypothetical protein